MIYDWLEKGPIDLEYKQYKMLSYLQKVDRSWDVLKLYPYLSEVVEFNRQLIQIKENKEFLDKRFPKELIGIDLNKQELIYQKLEQPNLDVVDEISEIIEWGIEKLDQYSQIGMILYGDISEDVKFKEFGVESKTKDTGYIIFNDDTIKVYSYNVGKILLDNEGGRFVTMKKLEDINITNIKDVNGCKTRILEKIKTLFNPSFYIVEGHEEFPFEETILPIVKRKLIVNTANKSQ